FLMAPELLDVSPNGPLTFSQANKSHEIVIKNVSNGRVTYKLQSAVYGRFNIKPRWGVLSPAQDAHIQVSKCKDAELSKKGRDKIVICCMSAPINEVDFAATSAFWRHNICYNPHIEKHQLVCHEEDEEAIADGD
ncbi:hypothetical protein KR018_011863, partial [Drosophila ironensis]